MASRAPDAAAVEMLRRLVAFPTVSRDPNRDLIDWVAGLLAEHGIAPRITGGGHPGKANLFATIPGRDGSVQGGLVLSGHTDVVPVDGQAWSSDPFALIEQNDRLYGRGAADMKGFIAVVLSRLERLVRGSRRGPVHLALSFDEEVGCKGVPHLLADMVQAGIKPAACIVGEPSSMQPVIGHKSGLVFNVDVEGREAHSSLSPFGINALEYAARLIVRIREIGDRVATQEARHEGYVVPYSTLQSCVIAAGHAANIVPARCSFRFDMRLLPDADGKALLAEISDYAENELLPAMRRVAPEAAIRIEQKGAVPGFATEPDAPLVRFVQRLVASNAEPGFVTFGSEAGLFVEQGVPSVICGPGDIAQAHKPDEFVSLDQLATCCEFIDRLADADLP